MASTAFRLGRHAAIALFALALLAAPAAAQTFVFDTPIAGDPQSVTVTLSDAPGGDAVDLTISIPSGQGDIRGLFGNVATESIVPAMAAEDPSGTVTQWQFEANEVFKVGGGNVMSPVKNWDWGLKFDASGPVETASFRLTGPGLTAAELSSASNQGWIFGVRVQADGGPKIGMSDQAPRVLIDTPAADAFLNAQPVDVSGSLSGAEPIAVDVNGVPATIDPTGFTASGVPLAEGPNTLAATASNGFGTSIDEIEVVLDTQAPALTIDSPQNGDILLDPTIVVAGTVSDANPIDSVTVNGVVAAVAGGSYQASIPLDFGPNDVTVSATDAAGNTATASITVQRGVPPTISIDSPPDGSVFGGASVAVSGAVTGVPDPDVEVNGLAASVSASSWSISVPAAEGANTITATATNSAGTASDSIVVFVDTIPPVITISEPTDGLETPDASVTVAGNVVDASAIGRFEVQGSPVSLVGGAFSTSVPLALGQNDIVVLAEDAAGNTSTTSVTVVRGVPPSVSIDLPSDGALIGADTAIVAGTVSGDEPIQVSVNGLVAEVTGTNFATSVSVVEGSFTITAVATNAFGSATDSIDITADATPPDLQVTAPQDGAGVGSATVEVAGTVSDANGVMNLAVNGQSLPVIGGAFSTFVDLVPGENQIGIFAMDGVGNRSGEVVTVFRGDPPEVAIDSPEDGRIVTLSPLPVSGTVRNAVDVTVNGVPATVVDGRYVGEAPLPADASSTVTVVATNPFGSASASIGVTYAEPPTVTIESPAGGELIDADTVTVTGTVDDPDATLELDGVPVPTTGTGPVAFEVDASLHDGVNQITLRATDLSGNVGVASVAVIRDASEPRVFIDTPVDGARVLTSTLTVSGVVRDLVGDSLSTGGCSVTVNGVPADIAGERFSAIGIALSPGDNTLTAVAVDPSGNSSQHSVSIRLEDALAQPRLRPVSGGAQSAPLAAALPAPLVVEVLDAAGAPLAGRQVVFRVRRGDGSLSGGSGSSRAIVVVSDALGQASAAATAGTRAGAGASVYEATSPGVFGQALFSTTVEAGAPAFLNVDGGVGQVGTVGRDLLHPFVVVVTDASDNRLAGVPVSFSVTKGGGSFGGQPSVTVPSENGGFARAALTLGPAEGIQNNEVEVGIPGLVGRAPRFLASAVLPGEAQLTAVEGVVLDNADTPIPNATLHVGALETVTDAAGQFRLVGVLPGPIHLGVEGATSTRPGPWPTLEFELVAVSGHDNDLGMPIFLPRMIDGASAPVDFETGAELALGQVPGLTLSVEPGSVTFAGGGNSGVVSIFTVHADKVPMAPGNGAQPLLPITIQPAGAHFDPPARLSVPNLEGKPPGSQIELFSFDHDLAAFVGIGTGTVSEDGSVIESDPGVGVVKGGWHFSAPPVRTGDAENTNVEIE